MALLRDFTTGVSRLPYRALGAPVDLAATLMTPLGYRVEKPVMGSEWLIDKAIKAKLARKRTGTGAELAGDVVGGLLDPSPSTEAALAAKMGGLLSDPAIASQGAKGLLEAMMVFHGSPHRINNVTPEHPAGRFDLSKVGTGEGAQAYGHGIYLAENPDVARSYKRTGILNPKNTSTYEKRDQFGHFYTVDLPDEHIANMLDWDAPLSEQPEAVKAALKFEVVKDPEYAQGFSDSKWLLNLNGKTINGFDTRKEALESLQKSTGGQLYKTLGVNPSEKAASEYLRSLGIPGIKYFDGGSRDWVPPKIKQGAKGFELYWGNDPLPVDVFDSIEAAQSAAKSLDTRSRNFVIFDPDVAKILKRE